MTNVDTNRRSDLRNVAIIAHVDHGKTTLVDGLLKQSHIFRDPDAAGDLIMDSNDLERERGITILSKNTAIRYGDTKINVIDTPGHADFGGEVERVLNMADGCILLVDSAEGPMPQTRTVLQRALQIGLRPIVVINKIDRSNARIEEVQELVMDLFLDLAIDESQLDFPTLYAIGRAGRAGFSPDALEDDLRPLLDTVIDVIPGPVSEPEEPFQMQVTSLDYDSHKGRIVIGRVHRGTIRSGETMAITGEGVPETRQKVASLMTFEGLARKEIDQAEAGELIAITGFSDAKIGSTICDPNHIEALPSVAIEEPTLKLTFGVNTSPFSGRDGDYSTSRQLKDRLERELEINLSLRVEPTDQPDVFSVAGRGELHISVLIETMRREGFEFQVSRPEVVTRKDEESGDIMEPIEHLVVDVPEAFVGAVTELTGSRKARMLDLVNDGKGSVRIEFAIPTRGLIGLRNAMLTATQGNAVMGSRLIDFEPWMGVIQSTRSGALVASETGTVLANGIANAQERGITFVEAGTEVYEGMIVGQNPRPDDLAVNICRAKKLTNMRSSTADIATKLTPPTILSLEQSLDFLQDDELLEVTPKALRLRKRFLTQDERQKQKKRAAMAEAARSCLGVVPVPIEETFDPNSPEVLLASDLIAPVPDFSEIVIATYSRTKLEAILSAYPHEQINTINTSALAIPIYVLDVNGKRIGLYISTIGGAASAGIMEEVIAMGGRKFLFFGSCGTLDPAVGEGAIVLPTAAWRDEGVSYHYAAAADTIEVPTWKRLAEILDDLGVPYHTTITWTTDAFYRETRATMQKRISAGCGVVDMECASTAAVADFRGVDFYQFVYGADSLAGDEWDPRTLVESLDNENGVIAELAVKIAERI